eukprot:8050167-Alexandrium_andersonii.AAC.1
MKLAVAQGRITSEEAEHLAAQAEEVLDEHQLRGDNTVDAFLPMRRWSNKEPGREQPAPTAELCGVVAYCTAAARVNRGNF